ncbi:hypothetical protein BD311DRAFT_739704 [Dichomitus squalens]|uniref:Uncharacterized protein n=1 Tax=Dichomitus squalens TaxID=114155 RepID=A0A4Q9MJM7_9APHY|nr:hypothetical protein BD311DRAFT_739704 [Dichomitus squalens]
MPYNAESAGDVVHTNGRRAPSKEFRPLQHSLDGRMDRVPLAGDGICTTSAGTFAGILVLVGDQWGKSIVFARCQSYPRWWRMRRHTARVQYFYNWPLHDATTPVTSLGGLMTSAMSLEDTEAAPQSNDSLTGPAILVVVARDAQRRERSDAFSWQALQAFLTVGISHTSVTVAALLPYLILVAGLSLRFSVVVSVRFIECEQSLYAPGCQLKHSVYGLLRTEVLAPTSNGYFEGAFPEARAERVQSSRVDVHAPVQSQISVYMSDRIGRKIGTAHDYERGGSLVTALEIFKFKPQFRLAVNCSVEVVCAHSGLRHFIRLHHPVATTCPDGLCDRRTQGQLHPDSRHRCLSGLRVFVEWQCQREIVDLARSIMQEIPEARVDCPNGTISPVLYRGFPALPLPPPPPASIMRLLR